MIRTSIIVGKFDDAHSACLQRIDKRSDLLIHQRPNAFV
jgi:hypothetical protein